MSTPVTTQFLEPAEYASWDALVAASPHGSLYSTTAYLEALCAVTGATYRILVARRGPELAGGIALYERRDVQGVRVSPRPLLFYNGVVLRNYESKYPSQHTARLLETTAALEVALSQAAYHRITLKSRSTLRDARAFMARDWIVRPGYTYVVSLADMAVAWERVEQNLRRLVNRCGRDGMIVTDDDDLDSFLRMHGAMSDRKGTSRYLADAEFRRFFASLRERNLCRLFHARLPDGRAISSQLVLLGAHPVSHSVAAAADAAFLNTGATAFLRWKVFEALAALGYAANDLTDAALNPVTHFKSQLGGELELCLIFEKPEPAGSVPQRIRSALGGLIRGGR